MLDIDADDVVGFDGDATFKITTGVNVYDISFEANGESGEYARISYSLATDKYVDVSAPDKAQNISDIIGDLVKGLTTAE